MLLVLLCSGCRAQPTALETSEPSPPPVSTPTYTATEAAFAANLNPLIGLPSEDPEIQERMLRAYAVDAGGQPAGLQAIEWVVETLGAFPTPAASRPGEPDGARPADAPDGRAGTDPSESVDPEVEPLLAFSLRRPEDRPELGPLAPATGLTLGLAEAMGAGHLSVLRADPEARASAGQQGIELWSFSGPAEDDVAAGELESAIDGAGPNPADGSSPGDPATSKTGMPSLRFDEAPAAGEPARALTLARSPEGATIWRYDPVFGLYQRYRAGGTAGSGREAGLEPVLDADTGEVLSKANLLLLELSEVPVDSAAWSGDGRAWLLRDGLSVSATWQREAGAALVLRDADGGPLGLRPGSSWLVLALPGSQWSLAAGEGS